MFRFKKQLMTAMLFLIPSVTIAGSEHPNGADPTIAYRGEKKSAPKPAVTRKLKNVLVTGVKLSLPADKVASYSQYFETSTLREYTFKRVDMDDAPQVAKHLSMYPLENYPTLSTYSEETFENHPLSMIIPYSTAANFLRSTFFDAKDLIAIESELEADVTISLNGNLEKLCGPNCKASDFAPLPARGLQLVLKCSVGYGPENEVTVPVPFVVHGPFEEIKTKVNIGKYIVEASRLRFCDVERRSQKAVYAHFISCAVNYRNEAEWLAAQPIVEQMWGSKGKENEIRLAYLTRPKSVITPATLAQHDLALAQWKNKDYGLIFDTVKSIDLEVPSEYSEPLVVRGEFVQFTGETELTNILKSYWLRAYENFLRK